jgi:hypothetical protein
MTTLADKFIVGRYIDLPTSLFPNNDRDYGAQHDGEFVEIPPRNLNISESVSSKQYGGRVSATGLGTSVKAHRNYRWLTYLPYRNTFTPFTGVDILTGFMSGCHVIAYTENGRPYLAHVGTADNANRNQVTKDAWNNYAASINVRLIAGFNPLARWRNNWPHGDISERPYCIALVTAAYDLHSIALFRQGTASVYRIAGIDQIASLPIEQLRHL